MPPVASSAPAPPAARSVYAWRGAAVLLFLLASVPVTLLGRDERSGWISMTMPSGEDHRINTLLGYSYLHGERPFMKENIPHVAQVGMFNGSRDAVRLSEYRQDFRFIRGLHSFLAALLTPPLDPISALLAVNWLCWAVCAWTAWRLTRDAFHSEAAASLAAMVTAGGMGMTAHIGDYSPHLLAFATYYLGVWLIYRSRVWRKRRPWGTHLRLGVYFATACLAYNTGVMLVAAYLAAAFRRNRPGPLLTSAAMALAARPLWQRVLAIGTAAEDVEADYLLRSLGYWRALLQMDLVNILKPPLRWLSEFAFFVDSPLVVALGMLAILLVPMPWSKRWFGLMTVAMPFLAGVAFAPMAPARGYIVYGASIWVYACLAYAAARGWASGRRPIRVLTTAAVVATLATHLPWSQAHLARNLGPIKSFFLGWDDGWGYFFPTRVLSLTGEEPTPVLFGGKASLAEAGAYVTPGWRTLQPEQVSFVMAVLAGGFFALCLTALAVAAARTPRQRIVLPAAWIAFYLTSCAGAALLFRQTPAFFEVDRGVILPPGERLRLDLALSPQFAAALRSAVGESDSVVLYVPRISHTEPVLRLEAGDEPLPTKGHDAENPQLRQVVGDGVQALVERRRLSIEYVNAGREPLELRGWQRSDLPGRTLVRRDRDGDVLPRPPVLPAVEVRVVNAHGYITLAGF